MANKAKRHTHKYYKVEMYSTKVWACALPDCNHYMPNHMAKMINGKASICWKCGENMILTPANLDMNKPECADCLGINDTEELPLSDTIRAFIAAKE